MRTHPRASLRISYRAISQPLWKSERGRFLSPAVREKKGVLMKKLLMMMVLVPVMALAIEPSPKYSPEDVAKYREKADAGDAEAQYLYARALVNGEGVKRDLPRAFDYALKSAEQGFELSYRIVGSGYDFGWCGMTNALEAAIWYGKFFAWAKPAADKGDAWAQYQLGLCLEYGNSVRRDPAEAVKWYLKSAEAGCASAQYNLGLCYEFGRGVETNLTETVKWYRKSAEQDHAGAQYRLGCCYTNEKGVQKDRDESVKWYRLSAAQGNNQAICAMGWCHSEGWGVPKNQAESVKWYRKAAENGDAQGQYELALSYDQGIGVVTNQVEAAKWYLLAARQGDCQAQCEMGTRYSLGKGIEKNPNEAMKWFLMAAGRGEVWGMCELWRRYFNGLDVEADPIEGVKWCRKAAEKGHVSACAKLCLCYIRGEGVETNLVEAARWYCKAAKVSRQSLVYGVWTSTYWSKEVDVQKAYDSLAALSDASKCYPPSVKSRYDDELKRLKEWLKRISNRKSRIRHPRPSDAQKPQTEPVKTPVKLVPRPIKKVGAN